MKLRTFGIVVCAVALAGCAAKKASPPPEPVATPRAATSPAALPSGNIGEQTVTGIATVQSVNQKTRHVTLKDSEGKKLTIVAGPDVRNLAQVKKGDVLRVTYRESMAYQVSKAGTAKPEGDVALDGSVREEPGLLDHVADAATEVVQRQRPDVATEELDRSGKEAERPRLRES